MKMKLFFKILPINLLFLFSKSALAQEELKLLAPLPGMSSTTIPSPGEYISKLYQFGLGIAGGLAMLMIIWGAVEWVISGAIDRKADAKDRITQAIFGLVLLLASVLILSTINPNLVTFKDIVPSL